MPQHLVRSLMSVAVLSVYGIQLTPVLAQSDVPAEPAETNTAPADITVAEAATTPSEPAADSPVIPVQTEPAPEPAAATERPVSRLTEEIVVTAQKREENLQDVPISINAFSAGTLDARGISDPKDLGQATPSLVIGSQAGYTITYLRGVGSDAFLLADPSVALYIDNVYFPFAHGQAQNFGSIERVEVLKGPQGTLFGRNAVGGAISVVTKNPSFDAPEFSITSSYGSFNDWQNKAQLNVPLTDNLAIALSGVYNRADNYRDGLSAGQPLPLEITRGARAKVRWKPFDRLELTGAGFILRQTGASTMFATNSEPSTAFAALIEPQRGLDGEVDDHAYLDIVNRVYYGQATLFNDAFDVKLIGSHQFVDTAARYDFDGSPTPLVYFEVPSQGAKIKTAELQLLSNDTSWASDKLKWIVGYYYYDGFAGLERIKFGVGQSIFTSVAAQLNPQLALLGIPNLLPEDELAAYGQLQTDSNSIFAQATYAFTDWLSLTLGARAQEEKRTLVNSGGAIDPPQGPDIPYTQFNGQSDTTRSLSPKVSFELRPWDEGLVYATYQEAVKSSTYNVVNFLTFDEPQKVKAEKMSAYEVGFKKALFDGSTSLSSAVFYYEQKNLQVQFISLAAGGAVTFENAPAAEVKGLDFDLTSELFPSVAPGLVLTLGGAYVDAKFTDYKDGQGFNELGVYTRGNDYTGNRIPRSPKFSGTLGLSQTFEIPGGPLEVAGDYYYNDGFFYLAQNTSFNEEGAYGLLGARISYLYEAWALRVTAFGKNLTDERYTYGRFPNDFGGLDAFAPPVTYGMRVNWDF